MQKALEGLKVADFSWAVAGPSTSKYMAIFGAKVVKVETRQRFDPSRMTPPHLEGKPGANRSGFFANHNPSKMSLAVNLNTERGRDLALRLVMWADIVMENFSPGTMAEWGLNYASLKKLRPDIIMFSSSLQGQTGPHASHPGLGNMLQALVGIDHLCGWPEADPMGPAETYVDLVLPGFGVAGIMAALEHRRKTGDGQYIDLSQFETAAQFVALAIMDFVANGRIEARVGNRVSYAAPHGVFRCAGEERWCTIAVETDAQWRAFCNAMGGPEWSREKRFQTLLGRQRNVEELERLVGEWTLGLEAEEVASKLQGAGIPAWVVNNGKDLHSDPQLSARGYLWKLQHPVMGLRTYAGPSFRMSATPAELRYGPLMGEHNEYVCRELLKLSDEEFASLIAEEVLE